MGKSDSMDRMCVTEGVGDIMSPKGLPRRDPRDTRGVGETLRRSCDTGRLRRDAFVFMLAP
jgi:hypothetical protein